MSVVPPEKRKIKRPKVSVVVVSLIGILATLSFVFANIFYWIFRSDAAPNFSTENWGQYGDFIGGITNPTFALFSFVALLYTVILQKEELKETRKEAAESRRIAEDQVNHLKKEAEKADIVRVLAFLENDLELALAPFKVSDRDPEIEFSKLVEEWIERYSDTQPIHLRSPLRNLAQCASILRRMNMLIIAYEHLSDGYSPFSSHYDLKYFSYASDLVKAGLMNPEKASVFLRGLSNTSQSSAQSGEPSESS